MKSLLSCNRTEEGISPFFRPSGLLVLLAHLGAGRTDPCPVLTGEDACRVSLVHTGRDACVAVKGEAGQSTTPGDWFRVTLEWAGKLDMMVRAH